MLDLELITGFTQIDQDHENILNVVSLLYASNYQDRHMIMSRLLDYLLDHFTLEERLMRRSFYPDLDEHHQAHTDMQMLIAKMTPLALKEIATNADLTPIRQSLYDHILIHDKKLAAFLQREGITSCDDL